MKASIPIILAAMSALSGCASPPAQYDQTKEARLRVFHGVAVYMHPDKTCFPESKADAIHAAAGGFSMLVPNRKIGMPESEGMGRSFHEFQVQAQHPLTLEMEYAVQMNQPRSTLTNRCGPIGVTFVPQAGRDYETSMVFKAGHCEIRVTELQLVSDGPAKPVPIDVKPAYQCR